MKFFTKFLVLATAVGHSVNATASDENYLFPESLKIPLVGPSKPADICMLPSAKLEFENQLNAIVEVDCIRLSVSAVDDYDEKNDVFLLLAYAETLHDRGWETTDMVSGTPLIKSPHSENGCSQHLMISGGLLSEYFPDEGYTEDEGQYIFISIFMDDKGEFCGSSIKNLANTP
jgi:hypothetical protein